MFSLFNIFSTPMRLALPLLCVIVFCFGTFPAKAQSPCDTLKNYRDFDFWVGEWDVYVNDQKRAESSITFTNGKCGILEDYRPLNTPGGNSISYFDVADGRWKQEWVSNGRVSHYIEPESYTKGQMQLIARHTSNKGNFLLRMIYYHNKKEDTVRQVMDRSDDNGQTWKTIFDGLYRRKRY